MIDKIIPKFLRSDQSLHDFDTRLGEITRISDLEAAIGPVQYTPQRREVIPTPHTSHITPAPQAQRRRLSEAAAQAAQQWEDLEAESQSLKVEIETLRAKNSVLSESNLILHEELEKLKIEHDYHERRCIRLLTYIEQVGSLALSAAKDIEPELIRHAVEAATQPKPENRDETPPTTEECKVPLNPTEANPPRPEGGSPSLKDSQVRSDG